MVSEPFVNLRPSKIHGVGLFAVNSIPVGTRITLFDHAAPRYVPNSARGYLKKMAQRYGLKTPDGWVCPHFNRAEVGWYMNTATDPNIVPLSDGITFEAIRHIHRDEEITVDYRKCKPW